MSVECLAIALHHSRARGTAKLVLLGIANHDGDGGAWPSVATLARYANVHPRKVQEALGRLRDLGEVIVHPQAGGLAGHDDAMRPNLYRVVLSCPVDCDRTPQHRTKQLRLVVDPVPKSAPPAGIGTPPVPVSAPDPVPVSAPEPSTRTTQERAAVQTSPTEAAMTFAAASPEQVRARAAEARAALAARRQA